MASIGTWSVLLESLFVPGPKGEPKRKLKGPEPMEWLHYVIHDFDEIDRIYIDAEVIGGA